MKKILIIGFVFLLLVGCEQQGVVNIDDCIETIIVQEDAFLNNFKTFTCMLNQTEKEGIHRGGICANIKLNENNECKKVYIYEKLPSINCAVGAELNNQGNCKCIQNGYIFEKNKCIALEDTQLGKQVSEYNSGLTCNGFLNNEYFKKELQNILGGDYTAYEEFFSMASCTGLELDKERNAFFIDIFQPHVGGYSSIIAGDFETKKIYLYWLKSTVKENDSILYGGDIPTKILNLFEYDMNQSWGHVANFSITNDKISIKEN